MSILYDLIFALFVLACLPVYLFKRKFHPGFMMRLGFLPQEVIAGLEGARPIWVHAVSVGEVLASKLLIDQLRKAYPKEKIVISTVTSSSNKIALGMAKPEDTLIYLPLDFSFIVKRVINIINPRLFIIAETEIWPNLISYLSRRATPIVTVNARISDGSFIGYSAVRVLIKPILNKINLFCVQTKRDADRLLFLGVKEEKINITGNMKFDNADYSDYRPQEPVDKFRSMLRLSGGDKLLAAGSTHKGEEEIILSVYKKLLSEFPALKLLIAPRHPERAKDISKLVLSIIYDCQAVFVSNLRAYSCISGLRQVFILDVMGKLKDFYKLADIVFVGGSLIKKGGHNILEPAYFEKPVIFGPYMFNFNDMAKLFLANKSAVQVRSAEELFESIRSLLKNPQEAADLGYRAKGLLAQNRGATVKNLEKIKEILEKIK